MERKGLRRRIPAEVLDEPMPTLPLVEIAGNTRVLVENHMGITQYGCDSIRIKVKYGAICVEGSNLELTQMTRGQLVICGCIEAVRLYRGESL